MDPEDILKPLRVRHFSQKKQRWIHVKKSILTHIGQWAAGAGSSSSGSSNPPSPTTLNPSSPVENNEKGPFPSSIQVLTWNIDFMQPNGKERTTVALNHIQCDVFRCQDGRRPDPCVILLQEIHPESLPAILEHDWVRNHFNMIPTKEDHWPQRAYGNVTMVSRTIPVLSAQLLAFGNSIMGRHVLLVDLRLGAQKANDREALSDKSDMPVTLRIANVHLESLPYGASTRPVQLAATATMLREKGIHAGIVGGDMNAISPGDGHIHEDAGLLDAWLDGDEDEKGFTWGYQPPSEFAAGRLDKIFYTSMAHCAVEVPQQVGVGLKTAHRQWVTDHYGLVTTARVIC